MRALRSVFAGSSGVYMLQAASSTGSNGTAALTAICQRDGVLSAMLQPATTGQQGAGCSQAPSQVLQNPALPAACPFWAEAGAFTAPEAPDAGAGALEPAGASCSTTLFADRVGCSRQSWGAAQWLTPQTAGPVAATMAAKNIVQDGQGCVHQLSSSHAGMAGLHLLRSGSD